MLCSLNKICNPLTTLTLIELIHHSPSKVLSWIMINNLLKQVFRPNNAVNWFWWCVANCTSRVCFLWGFGVTLIALCASLNNQLHLSIVASSSAFYKRHISCETQPVHMVASRTVVECIKYNIESLEVTCAVLWAEKIYYSVVQTN